MTLNSVMALTMRYFNEFAFQRITASSSIEITDQKSASVTHIVKLVCVTKFMHSQCSEFYRYLLVIYRLSFALPL